MLLIPRAEKLSDKNTRRGNHTIGTKHPNHIESVNRRDTADGRITQLTHHQIIYQIDRCGNQALQH